MVSTYPENFGKEQDSGCGGGLIRRRVSVAYTFSAIIYSKQTSKKLIRAKIKPLKSSISHWRSMFGKTGRVYELSPAPFWQPISGRLSPSPMGKSWGREVYGKYNRIFVCFPHWDYICMIYVPCRCTKQIRPIHTWHFVPLVPSVNSAARSSRTSNHQAPFAMSLSQTKLQQKGSMWKLYQLTNSFWEIREQELVFEHRCVMNLNPIHVVWRLRFKSDLLCFFRTSFFGDLLGSMIWSLKLLFHL